MTSPAERRMDAILAQYVSTFEKLDDMQEYPDIYPITGALAVGQPGESGMVVWCPRKTEPEPALLEFLHSKLPARFPPLFERLLIFFFNDTATTEIYTLM